MSVSVCLCVCTLTHKHAYFWKDNKVQVSDYRALECNLGSDPIWIYPSNLWAFILLQRNSFETRIYFDWTKLKYSILFCVPFQIGMMFQIELNLCLANDLGSHIREKSVSVFFALLCHYFWTAARFLLGFRAQNGILHFSICFRRSQMYTLN